MCPEYPQCERGKEAISGGVIISSDRAPQDLLAGDLEGHSTLAAMLLLLLKSLLFLLIIKPLF